jgi:MarR family transcriptional regulator, organic hydroperoxide resistance regulator
MSDWPIGRLLSTASRLVENAWHEALAEHDLTHAGLIVLHFLHDGPLSQSALATLARVENQTMSRTLERLERSGFVRRDRDAADGRRVLVSRTDAGTSVFQETCTIERELFPDIEQPQELRRQLEAIIRATGRWGD